MENQIKSNTCPYCDGPYTIADRGCKNKCRLSQYVANLVAAAADADVIEEEEYFSHQ